MTYEYEGLQRASQASKLDKLASEIIHEIYRHLTLSSKVALALSCRRFYNQLSLGLPHWRKIHDDAEQCRYLVVLEHFGFDVGPFVACTGCQSVHFRSWFPSDQLALKPGQRRCLKKARKFWVEPHKYLSFEELQNSSSIFQVSDLKYTVSSFLRPERGNDYGDSVVSKIKLLTVPYGCTVFKDKLRQILSQLNIPTCPHIRFSDDILVNSYRPDEHCAIPEKEPQLPRYTRRPSIPVNDDYDFECSVDACITRFRWHVERERDGEWKSLYLSIRRYVGELYHHTDKWLQAQLLCTKEGFDDYAEACFLWKDMAIDRQKQELALQMSSLPRAPGIDMDIKTLLNSCLEASAPRSSGDIDEDGINKVVTNGPQPPAEKMYEPVDIPPTEDRCKARDSGFDRRYEGAILPPWQRKSRF